MRVSTSARYGLLVMVHLAADPCPHTAHRLAREAGVPRAYIPKVAAPLLRRRLLTSRRGLHGGDRLACDPRRVTAWDVICAIDGLPPIPAARHPVRVVDALIAAATEDASARLARCDLATLAEMMSDGRPAEVQPTAPRQAVR